MKIQMIQNADHRLSGGKTLAYRTNGGLAGDGIYAVPRSIAEVLIKRSVARKVATKPKPQEA